MSKLLNYYLIFKDSMCVLIEDTEDAGRRISLYAKKT